MLGRFAQLIRRISATNGRSRRAQEVCDPDYQNGSGSNTVVYKIPLIEKIDRAASVRATVYYQSVPPYYLTERATGSTGLDTDRLARFQRKLSHDGTPVEGWKVEIASVESSLWILLTKGFSRRR
jgi:hypothetical protein